MLTLGAPDGNLVQAQKYAQIAVLTTGVDLAGDGTYYRAATHPSVTVVGAAAERLRVFAPGAVHARRGPSPSASSRSTSTARTPPPATRPRLHLPPAAGLRSCRPA